MGTFKLLKNYNGNYAGETITVGDHHDEFIESRGYGERIGEKMIEESLKNKMIETVPKNKMVGRPKKNK